MGAVVVFGCPKFAWMRPYWFAAWRKAWPDCPYEVQWVGNEKNEPWGACYLKWAQKHAGNPHLVLLDDYMVDQVNTDAVHSAFGRVIESNGVIGCVRLKPTPGPTLRTASEQFGEIDRTLGIPNGYPISLQPAVWLPETLAWHIEPHYSPWQVEIEGSRKAPYYHGIFLGSYKTAVGFRELSVKGHIQQDTLAWVRAL